jgi:hypothetical protein
MPTPPLGDTLPKMHHEHRPNFTLNAWVVHVSGSLTLSNQAVIRHSSNPLAVLFSGYLDQIYSLHEILSSHETQSSSRANSIREET